jgi:hypothetical protein
MAASSTALVATQKSTICTGKIRELSGGSALPVLCRWRCVLLRLHCRQHLFLIASRLLLDFAVVKCIGIQLLALAA